jgi:hypothetical protein
VVVEVTIAIDSARMSKALVGALLDRIHDRWFDLDHIRFDEGSGVVVIPFGDSERGPFHGTLTLKGVERYEVEDHADIGVYDINRIAIEPPTIVLTSGFPLRLTFHVGDNWAINCDGEGAATIRR